MSETKAANLEILILVIGGLWLYGRWRPFVLAQRYDDCLHELELIYSPWSDERGGGTA